MRYLTLDEVLALVEQEIIESVKIMQLINLLDRHNSDMKPPLQELAKSDDRLVAIRAEKLLELVSYLEAQGSAPRSCGIVGRAELRLSPYGSADKVWAEISVDWPDYGPMKDGRPVMHYRIRIRRGMSHLTEEERVSDLRETEQVIWKAFGWIRP